ncbi:hypothetical protein ACFPYI_03270 [Halomarina salina]|uniref:LppX_LprAFG lipoprotein n=1 Tax=Halomarina salina TaxID=1872699 RepID=A0ABD5RIP3_9EURY|nr:hypothetical protein [Halomarina salina]
MRRTIASVLVLVLLVTTAGCSSVTGSDSADATQTETTDGAEELAADQTETSDGDDERTAARTETTARAYPVGFDESGAAEVDAALENHLASLTEQGTFTVVLSANSSVVVDGSVQQGGERVATRLVDVHNQRALTTEEWSGETTEQYATRNATFVYTNSSDEPYDVLRETFNASKSAASDELATVVSSTSYDAVTTHENGSVTYSEASVRPGSPLAGDDEIVVETFSSTMHVTESGQISSLSLHIVRALDGGDYESELSFDITYRDVGSTTVEDPHWMDELRERL